MVTVVTVSIALFGWWIQGASQVPEGFVEQGSHSSSARVWTMGEGDEIRVNFSAVVPTIGRHSANKVQGRNREHPTSSSVVKISPHSGSTPYVRRKRDDHREDEWQWDGDVTGLIGMQPDGSLHLVTSSHVL